MKPSQFILVLFAFVGVGRAEEAVILQDVEKTPYILQFTGSIHQLDRVYATQQVQLILTPSNQQELTQLVSTDALGRFNQDVRLFQDVGAFVGWRLVVGKGAYEEVLDEGRVVLSQETTLLIRRNIEVAHTLPEQKTITQLVLRK